MGDPTAKDRNRINLNPIVHIDPVWTLLVPAVLIFSGSPVVFGAAKPVPVNPGYFKDPRRGMLWVAIAGPIINFILAGISFALFFLLADQVNPESLPATLIINWLVYSVLINVILGLFNLIPVPPLDGSRILVGILPPKLGSYLLKLDRYGFLLIIGIIYLGVPEYVLGPVLEFVQKALFNVQG